MKFLKSFALSREAWGSPLKILVSLPDLQMLKMATLLLKSLHMRIVRQSAYSGRIHQLDIKVTKDQLAQWMAHVSAQRAFSTISPGEREFIMTGITNEEWEHASDEWILAADIGEEDENRIAWLTPGEVEEALKIIKRC